MPDPSFLAFLVYSGTIFMLGSTVGSYLENQFPSEAEKQRAQKEKEKKEK